MVRKKGEAITFPHFLTSFPHFKGKFAHNAKKTGDINEKCKFIYYLVVLDIFIHMLPSLAHTVEAYLFYSSF